MFPNRASTLLTCLLAAALVAGPLSAEPRLAVDVRHADGRYWLSAHMEIAAPATAVRARLTDYANLTALNPAIRRSSMTAAPAPYTARVTTMVEACIQRILCRTLKRVEDVREAQWRLVAVIVPAESDFRAGRTEWRLRPRADGVRVEYRAELTPDFSVPQLLGTALVKQSMERELRRLLSNLERLARGDSAARKTAP